MGKKKLQKLQGDLPIIPMISFNFCELEHCCLLRETISAILRSPTLFPFCFASKAAPFLRHPLFVWGRLLELSAVNHCLSPLPSLVELTTISPSPFLCKPCPCMYIRAIPAMLAVTVCIPRPIILLHYIHGRLLRPNRNIGRGWADQPFLEHSKCCRYVLSSL